MVEKRLSIKKAQQYVEEAKSITNSEGLNLTPEELINTVEDINTIIKMLESQPHQQKFLAQVFELKGDLLTSNFASTPNLNSQHAAASAYSKALQLFAEENCPLSVHRVGMKFSERCDLKTK